MCRLVPLKEKTGKRGSLRIDVVFGILSPEEMSKKELKKGKLFSKHAEKLEAEAIKKGAGGVLLSVGGALFGHVGLMPENNAFVDSEGFSDEIGPSGSFDDTRTAHEDFPTASEVSDGHFSG